MFEKLHAQFKAQFFAHHAGAVNKHKKNPRLKAANDHVGRQKADERAFIAHEDALVDDVLSIMLK